MNADKKSSPMASNDTFGIDELTSGQIRAARALLQWDQKALAERSKVSLATIKRLEPLPGPLRANRVTIDALRRAFESAGIQFIPENGGGAGVRLASRSDQS
ncbi:MULTISPECIES: helix-turn-helix transcriptional regulator [unclassified Mesorhizobium]|uniref:helix-turn-helix domain-containing protein n=1 Tax=unclassified Mesorhizobium TaxID=325217 RepID=UPI002961F5D4|nr:MULTISPECIES: helix-turn-helix transcriptional regulator [unclassified Mesorhizobium]